MKKKFVKNEVVIYQAPSGAIELRGDARKETIWATQAQIAKAFAVDVRTINEHIKNIYTSDELKESSTIRKFRIVQKEGKRTIDREVHHYNLDMILSVGYRVNSKRATQFRVWATKTLKEYITKGYAINRRRIAKNYTAFMKSVTDIQALLPEHVDLDPKNVLELIKEFASTWVSLDAYDKQSFTVIGATKKSITLTGEELAAAISKLRSVLMRKGEATELFAAEKQRGSIEGIVGNVMQSFGGNDVYETIEEKAAHLLYFIVKNHVFTDGNKRSGAFAFIWFLRKVKATGDRNINPTSLTTLTLLVAESDPKNKDKVIGLILLLLRK
ncbi:MAG: virulence protein RhuM/Fic/DOC family protein [Patescibacteria group bacterium]